jgi:hypothetical protein
LVLCPDAPTDQLTEQENTVNERVREASAEVRIDLEAPRPVLRDAFGRMRQVHGVRVQYARRSDGVVRTDVTVEYRDAARIVPGAEDAPAWLRELVDRHRPAAMLDTVAGDVQRVGRGSFPMAAEAAS